MTDVWNVPHNRNFNFAGRERMLNSLGDAFGSNKPAARIQVLSGPAGIGKTQAAVEFAYRHRREHTITWWLRAYDPVTLDEDFVALAAALNIPVGTAPAPVIRRMVLDHLPDRDGWILIFDGAESPDVVRPYIPAHGGHVLVTSRSERWTHVTPVGSIFSLRVLEREEAVDLLQRRSGRADEWPVGGKTVAQALGDHPLAINQAAATIEQAGITFADYLSRYESYWSELLQSGRRGGEYPDTVAMTWELACRAVDDADPAVTALLKFCAFLGPVEIPKWFLLDVAARGPRPLSSLASPTTLDATIRTLRNYELIQAGSNTLTVHPIVAALARDRMPEEWRQNWCDTALRLMNEVFPFEEDAVSTWQPSGTVFPYVMSVVENAEAIGANPSASGKLLNRLGSWLYETGQYARAQDVLERALVQTTHAYGAHNPRRSAVVANLAKVRRRLGDLKGARQHLEEAIQTDRATYGEHHPHVAELANNLGNVLHRSGDVQAAREHFAWALEVIQARYGSEHPDVANVTNNLAYSVAGLGDVAKAAEHFETALATAEATYGPAHPVVAHILANMGIVRRIQGDGDAADDLFSRAIDIARTSLGADHTDVARILTHAALLDLDRGNPRAAAERLERALAIDERALGRWHVGHITKLNYLSRCRKAMDDVDGAVECHDRCAAILRHLRQAESAEPTAAAGGGDQSYSTAD
jgi:Tfp pilus assembly protein PilF